MMPLTVKHRDDLEKIFDAFAKLPERDQVTFPDPKLEDEKRANRATSSSPRRT